MTYEGEIFKSNSSYVVNFVDEKNYACSHV